MTQFFSLRKWRGTLEGFNGRASTIENISKYKFHLQTFNHESRNCPIHYHKRWCAVPEQREINSSTRRQ